jgi:hypothetical protein
VTRKVSDVKPGCTAPFAGPRALVRGDSAQRLLSHECPGQVVSKASSASQALGDSAVKAVSNLVTATATATQQGALLEWVTARRLTTRNQAARASERGSPVP